MSEVREEVKAASDFGQHAPNIIGNQEDKESVMSVTTPNKQIYDPNQSGFNILGQPKTAKEGGQGFNPNNFDPITPKRSEDQKERRQQ